jgi:DNA-binding GntR family transcriptional regulator
VTIAEASGSARLLDMISGFREYFLNRHWISRQNTTMAKRAQEDHRKIVAALRSGSADKVERILRSHLKLGWEELIAHAKSSR